MNKTLLHNFFLFFLKTCFYRKVAIILNKLEFQWVISILLFRRGD